ncbi:MAG: DUF4124 domain-containing protein [Luteimonas sp.]|nr:DUF4124 domain-containing protein [Luteimonas sp.]
MRRIRPLAALCLLLLATLVALPASAQIRRCTTADGGHVYTDRPCKDLGAVERQPRQAGAGTAGRVTRRDCSRNVRDLVLEMTAAIDNRDVNRLAGIYHWPGTSNRSAYAIMQRLDTIVQRPLIDITPVQAPEPVAPTPASPSSLAWVSVSPGSPVRTPVQEASSTAADAELPDEVRAAAARNQGARRAPVGLVVDQTVRDRITPLQTVFSLRRHLDCWWVSL